MRTNQDFKNDALAALRGNWTKAVLLTLLYLLLVSVATAPATYYSSEAATYLSENGGHSIRSMAAVATDPTYLVMAQRTNGASSLSTLISILILMPLSVGYANALRQLLVHGDSNLIPNTFHIAFDGYWRKVWAMLWMEILISLWSLLLLIPGIIKAFSYAMTPYILEDNPELTAVECIHRSRMMMRGHKFDLFWLWLSFIGWGILCIFTAGIGFLWLVPYIETSNAAFYEQVKADYALYGGLD